MYDRIYRKELRNAGNFWVPLAFLFLTDDFNFQGKKQYIFQVF